MRLRRWIVVGCTIGATFSFPLDAAGADGGAYIEFDRTHYLAGTDPAHGVAYVAIPQAHQDLLERGPFYVYLVPRGWIREGRPLPEGTIRVGTAAIEQDQDFRTTFRITTSFTVPDLPGDLYDIQICNDPCTISGFRESLSGQISIVQTLREATLLNQQQRLWGQNWALEREMRQAKKANEQLGTNLAESYSAVTRLTREIGDLRDELNTVRAARTAAANEADLLGSLLAIAAFVALLAISGGLIVWVRGRRTRGLVIPDTIAELDEDATETLART